MSYLTRVTNLFNLRRIKIPDTELSKPSNLPNLPVEIWIAIVKIVIDDSFPTFEDCTSAEFPQFLYNWNFTPLTYKQYLKYPESERAYASTYKWTNLRLVCRTWSDIVSHICRHKHTILNADDPSLLIDVVNSGVRSIRIFGRVQLWKDFASSMRPYPLHRDLVQVCQNISTIITLIDFSSDDDLGRPEGFLSLLIDHHEYFPNVRSLSIEGKRFLSFSVCNGIEKGFPQLTSLRLTANSFARCFLYLPNLKIFDFVTALDVPICKFPALTHASLRIPPRSDDPYPDVLDHSSHLQSLVIWPDRYHYFRPFKTFTEFPNLRMFGAQTQTLQDILPSLPKRQNHPLEHIWILDCTGTSIKTINYILRNVQGLRRLTITPSNILPGALNNIRARCRRKGLVLEETTPLVNFDRRGPFSLPWYSL